MCKYDYNEQTKESKINIAWFDNKYNKEYILKEAEAKKEAWTEPRQMFLLDNFRENINFKKDTAGGMFGSKIYFNFDSNIENIDDLIAIIQNQNWSKFQ